MGIESLVRSRAYKQFMAKLYGWGASLVIVGALFKIQHYPGAGLMLIIGLSTEAIIFFFSAFEPPHVEPDWSLVYPELTGMYHDLPSAGEFGEGGSLTEELDHMLEEAKITPELIESLGAGLRNLSETTSKLSDVTDASVATNEYVSTIKKATSSAGELTQNYQKTAQALIEDAQASSEYNENIKKAAHSANELAQAYVQTSQTLKSDLAASEEYVEAMKSASQSARTFGEKFSSSAESLAKSAEAIDFSMVDGKSYSEQLDKISKNLAALNSVYELQLKTSSEQVQLYSQVEEGMKNFLNNLNASIENTAKYKDEAAALAQNIAALNNVYGRMLTAMNANPSK